MWIWFALTLISGGGSTPATVAPGEVLAVTAAGSGTDLVFVPSLCGSVFGFREPTRVAEAAGYRTLVIEPLGFGHSSRPSAADYSLTAQSRRLAAALDQIGTKDAIFVAQGFSASIVLRLALLRPDLVRGVVSLEGGPAETGTTPGFRRALGFANLIKLGGRSVLRSQLQHRLCAASANPAWVTDAALDGYTAGMFEDLSATLDALRTMSRAQEPELLAPRLPEVNCPVELLIGATPHEGGIPPAELQAMRQGLRQFRVVTIPACGHFIAEERPEAILASIRRIERHSGANAVASIEAPASPEGR
jgi:pimeloyl-ACP methyl ester carboxylesterase